jgi:uncharacterized protein YndB with AHSA1/START domain
VSETAAAARVRRSVVVDAARERAFDCFVNEMDRWWNPDHHVLPGSIVEMVVEPWLGGAIYDRASDGRTAQWGTVVVFDRPNRFVFSWHVSPQWTIEPDQGRASEVEVTFTPESEGRTRVVLEHRHFRRHGEGWQTVRDAVSAPESWAAGLERYATVAGTAV